EDMRMFCEALYVFCAPEGQLAGISEKGRSAYGPKRNEFFLTDYSPQGISRSVAEEIYSKGLTTEKAFAPVDIAVFTFRKKADRKKKNNGDPKRQEYKVALPLNPEFEPWTKDIIRYYEKADTELVFDEKSKHYVDSIREKKIFRE